MTPSSTIVRAVKTLVPNGEAHPWRVLLHNAAGQELPMAYKTEADADAGLARVQSFQVTPFAIDRVVLDERGNVVSDTRAGQRATGEGRAEA